MEITRNNKEVLRDFESVLPRLKVKETVSDSKIVEVLDMNISRMKMPDIPEECCGIHPNRFPFQATGNRSCCGSKTYDPEVFDCCQGQIKAIGEC
jgi:hypothetical protein